MAQELEDGHSIICMRSTRIEDGQLVSNVVYNYGHITIPRHLRDIVITEYGVANLRGKTDSEVIKELLNITDSRFQETLLYQAKNYGKIEKNYRIPELFKKNLPDSYKAHLKHYKSQGYFPDFPFGTELTSIEVKLAKALKALKRDLKDPLNFLIIFIKALRLKKDARFDPYLERLELLHAKNLKAKIYQKLISYKLKDLLP